MAIIVLVHAIGVASAQTSGQPAAGAGGVAAPAANCKLRYESVRANRCPTLCRSVLACPGMPLQPVKCEQQQLCPAG